MDPKSSAMEDLCRGLGALGPTITEMVGKISELERNLANLSAITAKKVDNDSIVHMMNEFKEEQKHMVQEHLLKDCLAQSTTMMKITRDLEQVQNRLNAQEASTQQLLMEKADKHAVALLQDFDSKGILTSASKMEVPTVDIVAKLLGEKFDIIQDQLTKRSVGLGNQLSQKADMNSAASKQELGQLRCDVAKLVNFEDMILKNTESLANQLGQLRCDVEMISKNSESLENLGAQLAQKADEKWTKDQILGINQILLPVARAVRNMPTVAGRKDDDGTQQQQRRPINAQHQELQIRRCKTMTALPLSFPAAF
jgi:hypothetical protein